MQCGELLYRNMTIMPQELSMKENRSLMLPKKPPEKETIHSGHFMVSHFEAEAQDDEDVLVPVPEEPRVLDNSRVNVLNITNSPSVSGLEIPKQQKITAQHLSIETSLTKLFQCMSLAYR